MPIGAMDNFSPLITIVVSKARQDVSNEGITNELVPIRTDVAGKSVYECEAEAC